MNNNDKDITIETEIAELNCTISKKNKYLKQKSLEILEQNQLLEKLEKECVSKQKQIEANKQILDELLSRQADLKKLKKQLQIQINKLEK